MKLCIDAGHGLTGVQPRRYDPGAVRVPYEEATIALAIAQALELACKGAGIETVMTRRHREDPAPLSRRVRMAIEQGCTALISIHLNAAMSSDAHGIETLYKSSKDFALDLQHASVESIGLRDRGIKPRPGLAVLQFPGPCALIETGFISNDDDRSVLLHPRTHRRFAAAIVRALTDQGSA
jgi:N-acetylmuramoyl-L-alanine amidase